ncbi:MAG: sigma-70 family RNA polymerase sigma factor [Ferruginibacter sp.]
MEQKELIPHLFRTEFRKITAVLCKFLGAENMQVAEDIASETFLSALEVWPYRGIPANPTAWLYTVAKNKTKNHLQRQQLFAGKITKVLAASSLSAEELEIDLSEENITDSQLQMLFAICHPALSAEAQTGLALRILCGFGIDEIAAAFLTNKEAISKRLTRAKEKIKTEHIKIEFPPGAEINNRLEAVLRTLYLLFSEGYYSESNETVLREEFCKEAMRLTWFLTENEATNTPAVNALMALMCFHASRFKARMNSSGEIILYEDQDEHLWSYELIEKGAYFLNAASQGNTLSKYHLEASIAWWYTKKESSTEKWETILQLYNHLLVIEYSPVAALNRAYALSKARNKEEAIREAEKLRLENNHLYHLLLGELYTGIDNDKTAEHFNMAQILSNSPAEKNIISRKLQHLNKA